MYLLELSQSMDNTLGQMQALETQLTLSLNQQTDQLEKLPSDNPQVIGELDDKIVATQLQRDTIHSRVDELRALLRRIEAIKQEGVNDLDIGPVMEFSDITLADAPSYFVGLISAAIAKPAFIEKTLQYKPLHLQQLIIALKPTLLTRKEYSIKLEQLDALSTRLNLRLNMEFASSRVVDACKAYLHTGKTDEMVELMLPPYLNWTPTEEDYLLAEGVLSQSIPLDKNKLRSNDLTLAPLDSAITQLNDYGKKIKDRGVMRLARDLEIYRANFGPLVLDKLDIDHKKQFIALFSTRLGSEAKAFKVHRNPIFDALRDAFIQFSNWLIPKSPKGISSSLFGKTGREVKVHEITEALKNTFDLKSGE